MKKTTPNKATAKQETPVAVPAIRILKIASCPTLSGKSILSYHIGCNGESEIYLRIYANDGGGFFSNEWIPLDRVQQVFAKHPVDKPITSFVLHTIFRGKSVNTPAFLLAVLKQEGLVRQSDDKQRQYDRIDPAEFIAGVNTLIATDIDLKVDNVVVVVSPSKKTPAPSQPPAPEKHKKH